VAAKMAMVVLTKSERGSRAPHDKGVPVPEIAAKLVIKTGKNADKHPSVAILTPPRQSNGAFSADNTPLPHGLLGQPRHLAIRARPAAR
jgi:hypothetical protein